MSKVIPLRVSDQKWAEYSDKAQARGLALSTYLKQCVDHGDQVNSHLANLRQDIADIAQDRPGSAASADDRPAAAGLDHGLLVETVLLLRSVVGAEKLAVVHAELERQGLQKWTPSA